MSPERPLRVRAVPSLLRRGVLVGVLVHLCLFASSLLHFGSGEYMGVRDDALISKILGMFTADLLWLQAQLLGLQLAVGAAVGALAFCLGRAIVAARQTPALSRRREVLAVVAMVLLVHAWFVGRTLVVYPQVMYDAFFGANAVWRFVQTVLTDYATPGAFDVVAWTVGGASLLIALLAGVRSGYFARLV